MRVALTTRLVDCTSNALLINVFVILIPVFHRLLDVCTNSSCSSKWLVTMKLFCFVELIRMYKNSELFYYITVMSVHFNTSETNITT